MMSFSSSVVILMLPFCKREDFFLFLKSPEKNEWFFSLTFFFWWLGGGKIKFNYTTRCCTHREIHRGNLLTLKWSIKLYSGYSTPVDSLVETSLYTRTYLSSSLCIHTCCFITDKSNEHIMKMYVWDRYRKKYNPLSDNMYFFMK